MAYSDYELWKTTPVTEPVLSIVIPAYNEAWRIVPTIGAIASYVSELGLPWELIVADDGSQDTTVEIVEALGFANLQVLRTDRNGGKGSAVRRGALAAHGRYVLFTDADNSTPIEELGKLLHKVQHEGFTIAIGSRAVAGAEETARTPHRRVFSLGLRLIVRSMLHIGVNDTQCGFKLYTREAAQRLHTAQTLMGFSFDLELLYLAAKFGYRVVEVPVSWIDAPGSKVRATHEAPRFLRDLLRIKWNDLRGTYTEA
jgi:dolichyl-phosphate beta-glucosyltransferase